MGYIDIQDRENIDKNICDSLSGFYNTEVFISNKYTADSFILCPKLNSAIFSKPSKKVKEAVKSGHAIHDNAFKKVLMDSFLQVAFSEKGLFGCKYIVFNRLPQNCNDILIMPGNMKVKVFDYNKGVITNIKKPGFSSKGFDNEISIRTAGLFPFVLPMKLLDEGTYQEKLLSGCSLDRLSLDRFDDANFKVEQIIQVLQSNERKEVPVVEYLSGKKQYAESLLDILNCERNIKDQLASFIDELSDMINGTIILSKSHGDLQNGNIYVTKENDVFILDWETVSIRSIGYDLLTYFYKFRYRADFINRIDRFINDKSWTAISEKYYGKTADRRKVLAVYFFEDIIWLLEECTATSEKTPSGGLIKYASSDFQQTVKNKMKDI